MKVFKNKYGQWETLFANHILNGETIRYYMSVSFQRGQEPMNDSMDIDPTRWWGSCYLTKDGQVKPKLFIADWRPLEVKVKEDPKPMEETTRIEDIETESSFDINIEQEHLPFY